MEEGSTPRTLWQGELVKGRGQESPTERGKAEFYSSNQCWEGKRERMVTDVKWPSTKDQEMCLNPAPLLTQALSGIFFFFQTLIRNVHFDPVHTWKQSSR